MAHFCGWPNIFTCIGLFMSAFIVNHKPGLHFCYWSFFSNLVSPKGVYNNYPSPSIRPTFSLCKALVSRSLDISEIIHSFFRVYLGHHCGTKVTLIVFRNLTLFTREYQIFIAFWYFCHFIRHILSQFPIAFHFIPQIWSKAWSLGLLVTKTLSLNFVFYLYFL